MRQRPRTPAPQVRDGVAHRSAQEVLQPEVPRGASPEHGNAHSLSALSHLLWLELGRRLDGVRLVSVSMSSRRLRSCQRRTSSARSWLSKKEGSLRDGASEPAGRRLQQRATAARRIAGRTEGRVCCGWSRSGLILILRCCATAAQLVRGSRNIRRIKHTDSGARARAAAPGKSLTPSYLPPGAACCCAALCCCCRR